MCTAPAAECQPSLVYIHIFAGMSSFYTYMNKVHITTESWEQYILYDRCNVSFLRPLESHDDGNRACPNMAGLPSQSVRVSALFIAADTVSGANAGGVDLVVNILPFIYSPVSGTDKC
jgi:hypothetical protein